MTKSTKWLLGPPIILVFSIGLTGLAAGNLHWFVGDWPATVFVAMLMGMWAVPIAFIDPGRGRHERSLSRILLGLAFLAIICLAVLDHVRHPGRPVALTLLGLVLCSTAVPLGLSALRTLGRYYVPDPQLLPGQGLVTRGVYSRIRHPMYTATLLWILGLPLVIQSPWGALSSAALVLPILWFRIRQEKALLLQAFGDAYSAYQERSWRLIPFVL